MEGAHYIASGELLSFSEQQLVDCDAGLTKNHGCNGGNPLLAYRYYKSNAAELEEVYPYTSGTGDDSTDCLFDASSTTAVEEAVSGVVTGSGGVGVDLLELSGVRLVVSVGEEGVATVASVVLGETGIAVNELLLGEGKELSGGDVVS